ncbi:hypothetical protein ACFL5Q_02225 [Planctomycetota bacterium]
MADADSSPLSAPRTELESGAKRFVFKRVANTWAIRWEGQDVEDFPVGKAIGDLYYLVFHQGQAVNIADLPGNEGCRIETRNAEVATREDGKRIRRKLEQLHAEQAEEKDSLVREENKDEMKNLLSEYNQNFDKKGNPRVLAGDLSKMIAATRKRYVRFLDSLKSTVPDLVEHFQNSVVIDTRCHYRPKPRMEWDLGDE